MTAEALTQALYLKMQAEQRDYQAWLLRLSPGEILEHTYEYTIREDILMALAERELTAAQARVLLDSPSPLADICREWQKLDTGYMSDIRETIENHADYLLSEE